MNLFSTNSDSDAAVGSLPSPLSTLHLRIAVRSILCLAALLATLHPAAALACNVPVFRYALEKWRPDAYELVIFHDEPLTAEQTAAVEAIRGQSVAHGGHANLAVTVVDVNAIEHEAIQKIWDAQKGTPAPDSLPWLVLRTPVDSPLPTTLWAGKLADFDVAKTIASPARTELTKRLLAGDAVVWILVPGNDEDVTKAVRETLATRLKELESEIELPEGIGEPGSEVEAPVPLAIRFSILEFQRADPAEQTFRKQLLYATPDLANHDGPLVIPIFGAGRALDVLADEELEPKVIERAAKFLSGACSCIVKEQNPGFDLLLKADWESIFAGGKPRFARETKSGASPEPEYVPIAPGTATTPPTPPAPAPVVQTVVVPTRVVNYPLWMFVAGGVFGLAVLAILGAILMAGAAQSTRRERD